VVKHFKWIPKGKRRLHRKPNAEEIRACLPWLEAEIAVVRPEVIVYLGATAARTLVGPAFRDPQASLRCRAARRDATVRGGSGEGGARPRQSLAVSGPCQS